MKFIQCPLAGAYIIELEIVNDERGFFARSFCKEEFIAHGLKSEFVQCNISHNIKKGTIRGLHYQINEHSEAKLLRCIKGRIYDVIVDLRPNSKTFTQWMGIEISDSNRTMVYVPDGFAHGFQTLEDDVEVFYQMSAPYSVESVRGVRWNDPILGIMWPYSKPTVISIKDQNHPDFDLNAALSTPRH